MIAMLMRRFGRSETLTFDYQTFTRSNGIYHYDVEHDRLTTLMEPQYKVEGIRVTQRFAKSLDGTRVPYFLVHREDAMLDRPQPALLTGYGGFNAAWMPMFLAHLAPFVQAGGVLIHANLRGGAEYGKHWHDAGRLACKWNVFLDLFAVADQVIADGITRAGQVCDDRREQRRTACWRSDRASTGPVARGRAGRAALRPDGAVTARD